MLNASKQGGRSGWPRWMGYVLPAQTVPEQLQIQILQVPSQVDRQVSVQQGRVIQAGPSLDSCRHSAVAVLERCQCWLFEIPGKDMQKLFKEFTQNIRNYFFWKGG